MTWRVINPGSMFVIMPGSRANSTAAVRSTKLIASCAMTRMLAMRERRVAAPSRPFNAGEEVEFKRGPQGRKRGHDGGNQYQARRGR